VQARRAIVERLIALVLAGALLAACGQSGAPAPSEPTAAPAPAQNVTLLLWHGWYGAERATLGRIVERYNRDRVDGRISLQSVPLASFAGDLRAAVDAGSGPHLAIIPNTWAGDLALAGALLPLDEEISADELDRMLPATVAGARAAAADGETRLYGMPISFDTLALYYNAANVLAPPEDTATLLERARGLGDPQAAPPIWGLALNLSLDNMLGYLYAFGGRVFDNEGQVAIGSSGRAGAEQWLAWMQEMQADTLLLTRADSSVLVDRELRNGRAMMTFDWAHRLELYRNLWGENLGVAPLPRLSATNAPPSAYVRSDLLVLNSRIGAAERRAALDFLRYMAGEEAQLALLLGDVQPALHNMPLDGDDSRIRAAIAFRTQAEQGVPMPNFAQRGVVEQELKLMQRQVLQGLATPADAVAEAERRLRERLAQAQQ
jgi:ABC-type glycerol-3-phosphate transport system substrate-binding protein